MPLATKNNAIIVKDGKLAENCGCCGGWYCYAECLKAFAAPITFVLEGRSLDPNVGTPSDSVQTNPTDLYPEGSVVETWRSFGNSFVRYSKLERFAYPAAILTSGGTLAGSYSGSEVSAYANQQLVSVETSVSLQLVPITPCKIVVKTQVNGTVFVNRNPLVPRVSLWQGDHVWTFNPVINSDDFTSPLEFNNNTASSYQQEYGGISHTYFYTWFAHYQQQYPESIANKPCPAFSVSVLCDLLEDPRCLTP